MDKQWSTETFKGAEASTAAYGGKCSPYMWVVFEIAALEYNATISQLAYTLLTMCCERLRSRNG